MIIQKKYHFLLQLIEFPNILVTPSFWFFLIKQGIDNEPDGKFIYHWIPELANMPKEFIHMPWKNPEYLNGYPLPIVDEKVARKNAADKIYSVRKSMGHMLESNIIVQKHGSRKSPFKSNVAVKKKDNNQGELPL